MLSRRRRVLRVLLNPLVVVSVLVLVLTAGWLVYTDEKGGLTQARPGANLFPALGPTSSVDPSMPAEPVGGWTVDHSGDAQTSLELVDGELIEGALELDITGYTSGEVTLTSPRQEVEPGETYLFKTFTTSDADFTLLVRRFHPDGSVTLEQLPDSPERPGDVPFTVSHAFDSADTTTAVQYVFRLASTGTVRLEGAYLEPAGDVLVESAVATSPNLIPNSELSGPEQGSPLSWSPYTSGVSTVESGRTTDSGGAYLWTRTTAYQSGEVKWQYEPVPVVGDQYLEFSAAYRAETEVDVVAEFELADGGRVFNNLATVPFTGEWTTISEKFQAPVGATTAMVTLISHGDGATETRDYRLTDITAPGPLRWDQPRVSITFDDGWQSVFDRALPLLDEQGFRSTQYVNASSIETPNFMTGAQLQQLHDAGHEIAAHSYDHLDLTSIGTDRLDEQLRRSQEVLESAGFGTEDLAVPFGRTDSQVAWYASKYFDMLRGTDAGINTRQNLDPHNLKVFYVTDETTPETLAGALAETTRLNGWLILVYHQIATPESTGTQENTIAADRSTITSDAFADQVKVIADSGIQVQPVAQAFQQLQGQ